MNKLPCKLRREGWRMTTSDARFPDGVNPQDIVDVLFWDDHISGGHRAGAWIWGWKGKVGENSCIRCWRPSKEI